MEKILKSVDYHPCPLVKKIPSYVKDTNDFLSKLPETRISPESLLVMLDVTSLHTNMPHDEGLDACREALDTREVLDPSTDDIIKLIYLVLKRSNFSFDNTHYLPKHGTAMGTRMAPLLCKSIYGPTRKRFAATGRDKKPTTWWRYINDIFAI